MKLYGAISQRDIAHAIKELCGIEIDYHKVIIPHKIKEVGICSDVYIKLHHDVIVPVELNILPQESKSKISCFSMEGWPSGRRRMPGKHVYVLRNKGSNPFPSASVKPISHSMKFFFQQTDPC